MFLCTGLAGATNRQTPVLIEHTSHPSLLYRNASLGFGFGRDVEATCPCSHVVVGLLLFCPLQFLDLVAKQSDYLSTFIGGLTVELSSGRCDGAVTIRREALQVSYRVGGGEGGAAGGYKVLGMLKWSQIMTWSLVHQVSV